MQEEPGDERRARPVLYDNLTGASDFELAQKAGRRGVDDRFQRFEASGSGIVAGVGGDHRRRGGVHLDLLLDGGTPAQRAETGENPDYI
ncbi:MAG: hypothetical protein WA183_20030 [Chthoniobacterales bacterium]